MCIFAEPILKLLFPNAAAGVIVLQISSFTILFTALTQTISGALQGLGKVIIPTISLAIGVCAKCILNLVLIPIPEIGVNGAAIGSVVCHVIAFTISFIILQKYIRLDFKLVKCIIKPILATIMMCICSWQIYISLNTIISQKLTTIITLVFAVIIYILSVIVLKIFDKKEIYALPLGKNLYEFLTKIGIYK